MSIGGNVAAFPYCWDFSRNTKQAWIYLRSANNNGITTDVTVIFSILYKHS